MVVERVPEEAEASSSQSAASARRSKIKWTRRRVLRALSVRFSSSLTRRIVLLNLGGLVALLLGFLYFNQFRAGLIDAKMQSLQTQAQIIAAAIASSASADTDSITLDPEKLLQLAPGESDRADTQSPLEFSLNPEAIAPVLRRLVSLTQTRAQIYDRDGFLLIDSTSLVSPRVLRAELASRQQETSFDRFWNWLASAFSGPPGPADHDVSAGNGRTYPEVEKALGGQLNSIVRLNSRGQTIITVGVPIQRFRILRGALVVSTQGGAIDAIIAADRWAIVQIFLGAATVMLMLSLMLASTIAEPIRRLAAAAERVRRGIKSRQYIPDFSDRNDEIGHLSSAFRDMTNALYMRIEAIESFAADVAHELKNPLTSLRSAVETLPMARNEESREPLMSIIQHDVRRLDRLISDISDASRLDAELARADMEAVDLVALLKAVIGMANDTADGRAKVTLDLAPGPAMIEAGHDSRLAQVLNNLIDNARSFSPPGASVRLAFRPATGRTKHGPGEGFEIIVDDDGPGIPAHAFERIFERFYTDRPNQSFGQNSGLGLSISRQIVEAHYGHITASNRIENRSDGPHVLGARFTLWLPAKC